MTSRKFHETSRNLLEKYMFDCMYFPFTQIRYILTSPIPTSLEQFLRAIWGAVSLAAVLILPQIKLNLQLSCWAFFFKSTGGRRYGNLIAHQAWRGMEERAVIAGDTNLSNRWLCCRLWLWWNYWPGNKVEKLCQLVKGGCQGQAFGSSNSSAVVVVLVVVTWITNSWWAFTMWEALY